MLKWFTCWLVSIIEYSELVKVGDEMGAAV